MTASEARYRRRVLEKGLGLLAGGADLPRVELFPGRENQEAADRQWQLAYLRKLIEAGLVLRAGPLHAPRYKMAREFAVTEDLLTGLMTPGASLPGEEVTPDPPPEPPPPPLVSDSDVGPQPSEAEMLAALVQVIPQLAQAIISLREVTVDLGSKVDRIYRDLVGPE